MPSLDGILQQPRLRSRESLSPQISLRNRRPWSEDRHLAVLAQCRKPFGLFFDKTAPNSWIGLNGKEHSKAELCLSEYLRWNFLLRRHREKYINEAASSLQMDEKDEAVVALARKRLVRFKKRWHTANNADERRALRQTYTREMNKRWASLVTKIFIHFKIQNLSEWVRSRHLDRRYFAASIVTALEVYMKTETKTN